MSESRGDRALGRRIMPPMNIDGLLSALETHVDDDSLIAEDAARIAGGDAFLLMHAAAVADGRAREAMGTSDFQRWSAVAFACTVATRLVYERTTPQ
jgi:hypothetical protein